MGLLDDLNANTAALRDQADALERATAERNRARTTLARLERERGELCAREVAVVRNGVTLFVGRLSAAVAEKALQPLVDAEVVPATFAHREQEKLFRADEQQRSRLLNTARQLGGEIAQLEALEAAGVDVRAELAPLKEQQAAAIEALKAAAGKPGG